MRALIARIRTALTTWPSARAWLECASALTCLGALYLGVGFATGLLQFEPRPLPDIAVISLTAFFVPAIGEEIVFRGLLIPSRQEAPNAIGWILTSTVIFTAWHLVESLYLPSVASLFRRLDFLALAAALGLACAVLRRRSGSIWPPVVVHWAIVVAWLGWFGGPSIAELHG